MNQSELEANTSIKGKTSTNKPLLVLLLNGREIIFSSNCQSYSDEKPKQLARLLSTFGKALLELKVTLTKWNDKQSIKGVLSRQFRCFLVKTVVKL